MELVAVVQRSDGLYPGHMSIGQESSAGVSYFGFHLDPDTFPAEYRPPERWQEFLFSNKILGEVRDNTADVEDLRRRKADGIVEKQVACDGLIEMHIPPQSVWKHFAHYSFSPDDFHSDAAPCYNCVTWATMIGNRIVPGFITPVRQGRIKLIIRQLRAEDDKSGDENE